jgi:hypothetical protein
MNIWKTRRKDYDQDVINYTLLKESYIGGFTYQNTTNLDRFSNEPVDVYANRLKRSVPVNYVEPLVNEIITAIFSQEIVRNSEIKIDKINKPLLDLFIRNVGFDVSLPDFIKNCGRQSLLYTTGVLIDGVENKTETQTTNINEILNNRLLPTVKLFTPKTILNFSFSDKLDWVILDCSYCDIINDEFITVEKIVMYDKERWVVNANGVETEGYHNLGYVPFRFNTIKDVEGDKISHSIFESIALCQKKIYNYLSLVDQAFYTGIFTYLLFEDSESSRYLIDDNKDINNYAKRPFSIVDNVIVYPFGAKQPAMLRNDFADTEKIHSSIDIQQRMIYRQLSKFLDNNTSYNQSGVSKEIDEKNQNNNITVTSKQLEDAENWILKTFFDYMQIKFDDSFKSLYPVDFNVKAIEDSINASLQMMSLYSTNEKTRKFIKKQLLNEVYSNDMSENDKKELNDEIDNESIIQSVIDVVADNGINTDDTGSQ